MIPAMRASGLLGIALVLLIVGCAPPQREGNASGESGAPAQPKLLIAAIQGQLLSFYPGFVPSGPAARTQAMQPLVHAGLTVKDDQGVVRPLLAEAAPAAENGLWKVFPDGRMETTWRIKAGAVWQDGAPLTTDDLLFTLRVQRDPDLPFPKQPFRVLQGVEAADSRSITATWSQPYIDADSLFTLGSAPLPKHLLEQAYRENKAGFLEVPYWNAQYVGAGPYQVESWEPDVQVMLRGNDRYILGRPQIAEIVVKMIPNSNTLMANILAGEVALTLAPSLSIDQALQVRDNWKDGSLHTVFDSSIRINPQLLDPMPSVVVDLRFRRALMMAIDRQALADTLYYGLSQVADSWISPSAPEYKVVEGSAVHYPHDPQQAAQLIQELGYQRGPDGFFRDAAGQTIRVEMRVTDVYDVGVKAETAVADYWQKLGVGVESVIIPPQQAGDPRYRATFPAFELQRYPLGVDNLKIFSGEEARLPEHGYIGSNYARYINPEWDAMLDRYYSTIPIPERNRAVADVVHFLGENLITMLLVYEGTSFLVTNRLEGFTATTSTRPGWNVHAWDLK